MLEPETMSFPGHWPWSACVHKQQRAKDLDWIRKANRAWWSAFTLLLLLMWVILLRLKEGEAWISARRGLFSQHPGAANTVDDLAAETNTEQSVQKWGFWTCRRSANFVARSSPWVSAWRGNETGGESAETCSRWRCRLSCMVMITPKPAWPSSESVRLSQAASQKMTFPVRLLQSCVCVVVEEACNCSWALSLSCC